MDTQEPRAKDKFKDGSENTIQKRSRKTPQEPEPMVVNKEGDQQKRTKKEPASASEKKKRKAETDVVLQKERKATDDDAGCSFFSPSFLLVMNKLVPALCHFKPTTITVYHSSKQQGERKGEQT